MITVNDIIENISEEKLRKTLEKCIQFASLNDDEELLKWSSLELNGYIVSNRYLTEDVIVPEYRTVIGQYSDYYGNPIIIANPNFIFIQEDRLRNGVCELEQFLESSKSISYFDAIKAEMIKKQLGLVVYSYTIGTYQLETVFSGIREKLFDLLKSRINKGKEKTTSTISLQLTLSNLHPLLIQVAEPLFKNGHFREAILNVFIELITVIKAKSQKYDLDGTSLTQTVFSPKKPIIKISDDDDEQLGFMWLFSGAVMGIRNPNAHSINKKFDETNALEWLSFASALFKILDDAKIIKANMS